MNIGKPPCATFENEKDRINKEIKNLIVAKNSLGM
jgi:hypothetical protein